MDEIFQEEPWEELIDGQAVVFNRCPSINHNTITGNLCCVFWNYLYGKEEIYPFRHFENWLTGKDHFIPDFMVVCDKSKIKRTHVEGAPDLVVEVLSPSTARRDKGYKKSAYERSGVREYWIVNLLERSIEQYVLENGAFVLRDVYYHYPADALDDMTEEEKAEVVTEFHPAIFGDLSVRLSDVFYRLDE